MRSHAGTRQKMTDLTDIYLIHNNVNGRQYVGQAAQVGLNGKSRGYLQRWKEHKKAAKDSNKLAHGVIHRAIAKYGPDKFNVQKIVSVENRLADGYECMFIEIYRTQIPYGYNVAAGGTSGASMEYTDKMRQNMSKGKNPDRELP